MIAEDGSRVKSGASTSSLLERAGGMSDEDLLEQFLESSGERAEDAFAALMRRHGPMVLGVCRHVLGRQQDAEDAFQATFLVLARKAGSIRARNVLGRWLYEVAFRIAVRARATMVRRQTQERQGAEMSAVAPDQDHTWEEFGPLLHEELRRLPDKYRTPVILCYLEGKTNEEAAQLLKWPVGTVKGRLSRARDLLRSRLDRRGITLSLAFLAVALKQNRALAEGIPTQLVSGTTRMAVALKNGSGHGLEGLSPRVKDLMEHALRSVPLKQVLSISALLLIITFALTNVFGMLRNGYASEIRPGAGAIFYWAADWKAYAYGGANGSAPAPCHAPVAPAETPPR